MVTYILCIFSFCCVCILERLPLCWRVEPVVYNC